MDIDGSAVAVMLEEPLSRFYKLVDRKQLKNAMKELKFQSSDLTDTSNAKVIGKMIGAEYIITGTVVQFGNMIITAKVLDIETGEIKQTAKSTVKNLSDIDKNFAELAKILPMTDDEKDKYLNTKNNPQPKITKELPKTKKVIIKLTPEQIKYIKALKNDSNNQLAETARKIITKYPKDTVILDVVEERLKDRYTQDVYNRTHILAMSWLCKTLGASNNPKYKSLLIKIANSASSQKLRMSASKALGLTKK